MSQDDQTNNGSGEVSKKDDSASHATIRAEYFGLRWIIIGGCVVLTALLFISIYLPYLTERVKFFTVNFLSLLVLIIIAIQAFIYRRQWEAMQGQLKVMNRQSELMNESLKEGIKTRELENRAYVTIKDNIVDQPMKAAEGQTIIFILNNSGRTPAINVTTKYAVILDSKRPALPEFPPTEFRSRSHLANGDNKHITMILPPFTPDNVDEIYSRQARVWIVGIIEYEDIFKAHHRTQFCYYQKLGMFDLNLCEEGNTIE
jgi:hypothetical protein